MRTIIFFPALIFLFSCSYGQKHEKQEGCNPNNLMPLELDGVKNKLLGKWQYYQSFYKDTCFFINELGDLPLEFNYKEIEVPLIKSENPRFFEMGKEMMLFDLACTHDEKPYGGKSYLVARPISKGDRLQVMHYVPNGIGKSYSYYLEYLSFDTLIIRNQRNYNLGGEKITAVKHVYTKPATE